MRAAIYARYSAGPNQGEQSIEGQVRVCTDYCERNNISIVHIYADRGISGKTDERPEFQQMILDCKKHKYDAIVVYKTDRFARNKYDSAIYKRELRNANVKLLYAAEAIPDGPEGIILESLMEGLAEYYSAELAQKIRRGIHESALKCKGSANRRPFGYTVGENGGYVIDPNEGKLVKEIFDRYINGDSNVSICEYLNSLGMKTTRGNKFNKSSINRIIENQAYIGVYKLGNVVVEDGMPAIIAKDQFYLAQREMDRKRTRKYTRTGTANYLLSGKLFCGKCESPMSGVSGTGKNGEKHYYYYCPSKRKKLGCDKKHVSKDYIEALVVDITRDYILKEDVLEEIAHKVWIIQNEADDRAEKIAVFQKQLQDSKRAASNILKAVEKGLATEVLLTRLEELTQEQANLEAEIEYHKNKAFGLTEDQILFFLTKFIQDEDEDPEVYRKRIINCFVSKVYLFDDKISIFYNISDTNSAKNKTLELSFSELQCSTSLMLTGLDASLVEHIGLCINATMLHLSAIL